MQSSLYYPEDEDVPIGETDGPFTDLGDVELGLMGEESTAEGSSENPFLYPGEQPDHSSVEEVRIRMKRAGRAVRSHLPSKWTCCCCCGVSTVVCGTCALLLLALVLFVIVELAIFFFHHKDLAFLLF